MNLTIFKKKFDDLVKKSSKVTIVTHLYPDLDAVCSAVAIFQYLKKEFPGKKTQIVIEEEPFADLENLTSSIKKISWVDDLNKHLKNSDLVIFVDGNSLDRFTAKASKNVLSKFDSVCIDHHFGEPENFNLIFIDTAAISSCQIIADIFFGEDHLPDIKTAEILTMGILSDSGSLKYINSNNSSCLITVKMLIDLAKLDLQTLLLKFDTIKTDEFMLFKELIKNSSNIDLKNLPGLTYSFLPKTITCNFTRQTIDNAKDRYLFSILRSIEGFPWGFVVYPNDPGVFKISFRSSSSPDVGDLAKKYFSGGGKERASGGFWRIKKGEAKIDSVDVCKKVLRVIKSLKSQRGIRVTD